MKLFNKQEHLSCIYYDNGNRPLIELREIDKKRHFSEQSLKSKIIFVLEGNLTYIPGVSKKYKASEGNILFIPPARRFRIKTDTYSKILIVRLREVIRFCECYPLEKLTQEARSIPMGEAGTEQYSSILKANQAINSYLEGLLLCMGKGLYCRHYFEAKIKELFYLFRAFYSKEQMALFFREMLSEDSSFSYFVLHNYQQYKTATEFAAALNMSLHAFEKQFRAVFKMPAYRWMKQRKAREVYHAVCTEQTPLKELAVRFGFASKSSFSEFCTKNLGESPGRIRKKITPALNPEQIGQDA